MRNSSINEFVLSFWSVYVVAAVVVILIIIVASDTVRCLSGSDKCFLVRH